MAVVELLGIISILLTAVGTYRFSRLFFSGAAYPTLIAAGMTLSYIMFFQYLILLMGIAVLLLPVAYLGRRRGYGLPFQSPIGRDNVPSMAKSRGQLDPWSGPPNCPNCDERYTLGDDFCGRCGQPLET